MIKIKQQNIRKLQKDASVGEYKRTVIFKRIVNGRPHVTKLSKECPAHFDIVLQLYAKILKHDINLFYDDLWNQVVETY